MDNYSFKSVAFGGFDKQDVVRYLEESSERAAAARRELEAENGNLRRQTKEQRERIGQLEEQIGQLEKQIEELTRQQDGFQEELEAEIAALRSDAEAYAQFRGRLGAIEFEARKRADDLEEEVDARTRRTLEEFRSHYQKVMSVFESAAGHVNGELRKIEVTLSQLPRAMDQTGAQLNELAARLEKKRGREKKN